MSELAFEAPRNFRGELFREELERAGYSEVRVTLLAAEAGRMVLVEGKGEGGEPIGEKSRPRVEGLLAAHRPARPGERVDPAERGRALLARGGALTPGEERELLLRLAEHVFNPR